MKVVQTGIFSRTIKKLHKKDKTAVDHAVRKIVANAAIGAMTNRQERRFARQPPPAGLRPGMDAMKKGTLTGVRVYKFKVTDKQYLLAYRHEKKSGSITLLALGSHENFYRELSK